MASHPVVVVAEDEALFRELAIQGLQAAFPLVRVVGASNGREAVELIEKLDPSVVVTDLRMPELDGFGVLAFLAQRDHPAAAVVMSAFLSHDSEQRAAASGAIVFLEKPVDISRLVTAVGQLLETHSTGQLEGVTLPGFVQLLEVERQNVTLAVTTDQGAGRLHFCDGKLTDAWDGTDAGDIAAKNIFGWTSPKIDVIKPRQSDRNTISTTLIHLLMDAARSRDESKQRAEAPKRARSATARSFLRLHLDLPAAAQTVSLSSTTNSNDDQRIQNMSTITQSLDAAMAIDGTIGACIADWTSGMTLGTAGGQGRINIDLAGSLNCEVVRAKMGAMENLGIKGGIEDILITLEDQYHLIRPLKKLPQLFLYLAIDRTKGNLGLARMKLQAIEKTLEM